MLNIADYKNVYLAFSGILVGAAIVVSILFGFHEGIDFTGGSLWQLSFATGNNDQIPTPDELKDLFTNNLDIKDAIIVTGQSNGNYIVRFGTITEAKHQEAFLTIKNKFPKATELSFESIGPSISAELKKNALWAIALVLCAISIYIAFAFRRVSYPVSSWTYGWITLVTLFHDVAIPAGMLAVLGKIYKIEIDTNFIVALLVVMGFSVHDTIVVFDRIRENLLLSKEKNNFKQIINNSVNQSIGRSVNTSLTLILVLIALLIVGPISLRYFTLTLLVGVTTGIYSSIFVASPLLLLVHRKKS